MTDAILTRREGSVLVARINNSARRNAIAKEHCLALSAALADASSDPAVRALIITGDETAFCAGADLVAAAQEAATAQAAGETPDPAESTMLPQLNALVAEIQAAEIPVIAAVEGAAAGAGASLAFACDLIVAGEDSYFTLPFGKIGLIPDGGVSLTALASVGRHRALALALLQDKLGVAEAEAAGLVTTRAPQGHALATALEVAERLHIAPRDALAKAKEAINRTALGQLDGQLAWEEPTQYAQMASAGHKEGVTAFLEKRSARFD